IERPKDRVSELLEFTGLQDRSSEPVGTFSTGMKRKLGIARAILHEPEIVFFDEPTSGLDPEAQHMVRELILDLSKREGMTVFLNSHNLDEVQRICTRVAILHRGRIRALDSVRNLVRGAGKSAYVVTLADPAAGTAAVDILSSAGGLSEVSAEDGRVSMSLGSLQPHEVISLLVNGGIGVDEARREARSLEEIYLGVMGQAEGDVS
ncbi:MAG: ABC transporter ATP-binding protein, partial [Methanolinea sp.]|nr:ABC transporter ATP-binding protein [Methanolinea sp.]